jgi:histidyl-tRNA synthetase
MDCDMAYALKTADTLRKAGIPTEVYYANKGFKHKMKYADKLAIPYVAVIGTDEESKGEVSVKNMATGEQVSVALENIADIIK